MKRWLSRCHRAFLLGGLVGVACVLPLHAATVYVWGGSPSEAAPYDTWDKAAHSLPAAVAYAVSDAGIDTVTVTDGTYNVAAQMLVTNTLAIRSVNGPNQTTVRATGTGYRLFNIKAANSLLAGFTLNNAYNNADSDYGYGGGAVGTSQPSCVISNCVITGNFMLHYGGAVNGGTVVNCVISSNTATRAGGGLYDSVARNCLIIGNLGGGEGGGGGMWGGVADNCTILSNTAWRVDTGLQAGGGTYGTVVSNSIVYFNVATVGNENWFGGSYVYSCTQPLPEGTGNISQDPGFVDRAAGNYHLDPGPCVDTGTNESWMTGATDLDGTNRIVNGRVDMGCFEANFANGPLVCGFAGTPLLAFDQIQVVFTATVAGTNTTIATYAWDFGDGQVAAGASLAVVTNLYTTVGAYTVTLHVTNAVGESASKTFVDYITIVPRTLYVWSGGSATYPYDTMAKAANDIQLAAIAAQVIGTNRSTVLVTNGTYTVSSPVVVSKGIEVRSVHGPSVTVVQRGAGSRVFDLEDPGASLGGFTIRNGNVTDGSHNNAGAGVYCGYASAVVSNCYIINNFATHYGGGVWGGIVQDCIISNNVGARSGGGLYGSVARNCLIAFNRGAEPPPGGGGGMVGGVAVNCTIVSNTAWRFDGYGNGGGVLDTAATNCIIYFNRGTNATVDNWSGGSQDYTCTTPLPGAGTNNVAGDPMFKDLAGFDFHPIDGSPCLNSGMNLPWMARSLDLAGNPRLRGSQVDMGAYEQRLSPGTVIVVR